MKIHDLPTPSVLIDTDCLDRNIASMQGVCDQHGVELWPHIKTHKCSAILQRQLRAGARGMTCAKIGEAEALLPSGVRRIFIAHSIVDPAAAPRLKSLAEQTETLILAATSLAQAQCLAEVAAAAGIPFKVFMAFDTGLHREGCRSLEDLKKLVQFLEKSPWLEPLGLYTHEGHCNYAGPAGLEASVAEIHQQLIKASDAIGSQFILAPGCSASAALMASKERVSLVRPGAYCLGDLSLSRIINVMAWQDVAITIQTTVVDRPEDELALIDAGSKTFSGDKTAAGESGRDWNNPEIVVSKVNEEHGYVAGPEVRTLQIRDRLRCVPAHVCTTINQTDQLYAVSGDEVVDIWPVTARGKVS